MTEKKTGPVLTEVNLKQRSRILEIAFEDGGHFSLPCEYLRIYSPAAEVKAAREKGEFLTGKEEVNITKITPTGTYALQLHFDDGHDTGVYSAATLYELGARQDVFWKKYLDHLEAIGYERDVAAPHNGPKTLHMLYFVSLPRELGRQEEEIKVPEDVENVGMLMEWLKRRGDKWKAALERTEIKVTVNKKFSVSETPLLHNDEVALVSGPDIQSKEG